MEHRPVNGMAIKPFGQQITESRERVIEAATAALDAELERFILPADKIEFLSDYAKFACFLAGIKIDEVRTAAGTPVDKNGPLRAWYPLGKSLYREVPAMLLDYGREAVKAGVTGTADAAE
jgi:hypothetical protein